MEHSVCFALTTHNHFALKAGGDGRWSRQKSRFPTSIWLYRALSTLRLPGVINSFNTALPDCDKLWRLPLVVSGGVCWWREMTMKCLWQEVSMLRRRQQNLIVHSYKL